MDHVTVDPTAAVAPPGAPAATLHHLELISAGRDLDDLSARLRELRTWIAADLADVESDLGPLERGDTPVHQAAEHLLGLGGKRLRPMCVALAARAGLGFSRAARDLAVAAELVHNATLLHDDVVDVGELRRGAPTARVLYGNAASVYAGDWLLVEAIRRIRAAGMSDLLDRALDVLQAMLDAEGLQLALRGRFDATVDTWRSVVEGKTASLFRWALYAGGRAGGLDPAQCDALEAYGQSLGVAFQLVDDLLDVSGDARTMGKVLFTDLREGKLTHPLLLAAQRDPRFARLVAASLEDPAGAVHDDLAQAARAALRDTGALEDSRRFARRLSDEAVAHLHVLPNGRARDSLASVAAAMLHRTK